MANSSLILSSLDFDTLKQNFKTYLTSQSVLKDYNFDGSNINVLLDVMSYNSYLNSFYLNMIASEMFLDSAQKYDSVISHAKELNYVPRSSRSSVADVSFDIPTVGISGQFTIPKGTRFSGTNSNGSFTFTTDEVNVYVSGNSTYSVANLMIYEGSYFTDTYVVNYDIENQQYLITNQNVDISSITVTVIENNGANTTAFSRVENLFGLNDLSEVYFLQGAQNQKYEIVFGDGLFGRKPLNASVVQINYRVCNGTEADGISVFSLSDNLGPINGGEINTVNIIVNSPSSSGANQESIDSIRFAAPRYFATQQRAISSDDYAALILNNFGGEVSDVVIYGGETVEPKLYGRVIVSIKPASGTITPNYIKNKISNYLLDFIALPNRILISDPDYLYCYVVSNVQYDKTRTTKTATEIKTTVLNTITSYSVNNLEKFGNDLRYSRLIANIDNSDVGITSNDTNLRIIKRLSPKINFPTSYSLSVSNEIYVEAQPVETIDHIQFHGGEYETHFVHASLISSRFTAVYQGVSYPLSYFEDDGLGNIDLYTTINGELNKLTNLGTVDYFSGIISLNNLTASSYDNYISIYIKTVSKDIIANQNKIIIIDPNDVNITVSETQR